VPRVVPPSDILDMPRLADLIAGKVKGRTSDSQTTYFFNLGAIGAQFEAVAGAVYEKARACGLGTEIPTDWFLQDIRD
jgi:alanine dehydrogenase